MSTLFLRRHKKVLMNLTSASGLLALGDFCAQFFYEKKQSLDGKRLCMSNIQLFISSNYSNSSRSMCYWNNIGY
jgi:hypothetical protein